MGVKMKIIGMLKGHKWGELLSYNMLMGHKMRVNVELLWYLELLGFQYLGTHKVQLSIEC